VLRTVLRVVVACVLVIGVATIVMGFLPGFAYRGPIVEAHHAGSQGFALLFAMVLAPGIAVLRDPSPGRFAAWAMVGWVLALPFALVTSYGGGDGERLLPGILFEYGEWITMPFVLLGAPVLGFVVAASGREVPDHGHLLGRRLRRVTEVAFALGIAICVLGFLPGYITYDARVHDSGGLWLLGAMVVLLAPGVLLRVDPRRRFAWIWTMWALPALLLTWVGIDCGGEVCELWPHRLIETGLGMLAVLLAIALPVIAFVTRDPTDSEMPGARVVSS